MGNIIFKVQLKKEPLKKLYVWLDELDKSDTDNLIKQHEWRGQYYKYMIGYLGMEDKGIITAAGDENGSEAKLEEIRNFAKGL